MNELLKYFYLTFNIGSFGHCCLCNQQIFDGEIMAQHNSSNRNICRKCILRLTGDKKC